MNTFVAVLVFSLVLPCFGAERLLSAKVREVRMLEEAEIIQEYVTFLSIPNVASDKANIQRNAEFIADMMRRRGIAARLLRGSSAGANPVVFGEVLSPGATTTLTFYAHYDGQPVNAGKWAPGLQPFAPAFISAPIEHGGRLVPAYHDGAPVSPDLRLAARSAADDKAGVMTLLNAYAMLVKAGHPPRINIKFFFEGEEEEGSPHLPEILGQHRDLLTSDLWVIADGPRHALGHRSIEYGVRGDINMAITVYGPKRPLHSGNYGNWAPNPALGLARLLASMKDERGHVLVKGFYDDVIPLSSSERTALAATPDLAPALQEELAIPTPDGSGVSFAELMTQPSLNINGMQSGDAGMEASNIIPSRASAVLDLRLAKGNSAKRQVEKVLAHIRQQGYLLVDREPSDAERRQYDKVAKYSIGPGYDAQRTPMDAPLARKVAQALQSASREPVVAVVSAGGSLPLVWFERILGADVVSVPVVNYDNNQHAENENVQLRFLWEGIEDMATIMSIR